MDKPSEERTPIYIPTPQELDFFSKPSENSGRYQAGTTVTKDGFSLLINVLPTKSRTDLYYQLGGLFIQNSGRQHVDNKKKVLSQQEQQIKTLLGIKTDSAYRRVCIFNTRIGQLVAISSAYNISKAKRIQTQEEDTDKLYERHPEFYDRIVLINGVGVLYHRLALDNPQDLIRQLKILDIKWMRGERTTLDFIGLDMTPESEEDEQDIFRSSLRDIDKIIAQEYGFSQDDIDLTIAGDSGVAVAEFNPEKDRLKNHIRIITHEDLERLIENFKTALLN